LLHRTLQERDLSEKEEPPGSGPEIWTVQWTAKTSR